MAASPVSGVSPVMRPVYTGFRSPHASRFACSPGRRVRTPAPEARKPTPPDVLTELICERCGSVNLVRVKGCWYCEQCHYKFDCYGW